MTLAKTEIVTSVFLRPSPKSLILATTLKQKQYKHIRCMRIWMCDPTTGPGSLPGPGPDRVRVPAGSGSHWVRVPAGSRSSLGPRVPGPRPPDTRTHGAHSWNQYRTILTHMDNKHQNKSIWLIKLNSTSCNLNQYKSIEIHIYIYIYIYIC